MLSYVFKTGFRNLGNKKLFSFASIGTIASSVLIFCIFFVLATNIRGVIKNVETTVGIQVFFNSNLSEEEIQNLADTFEAFQKGTLEDVKGFCAVVDTSKIAEQDYVLTPGRYVGIEEQEDDGEPFEEKMTRLTTELSGLFAKSHVLEAQIRKNLGAIGFEIGNE